MWADKYDKQQILLDGKPGIAHVLDQGRHAIWLAITHNYQNSAHIPTVSYCRCSACHSARCTLFGALGARPLLLVLRTIRRKMIRHEQHVLMRHCDQMEECILSVWQTRKLLTSASYEKSLKLRNRLLELGDFSQKRGKIMTLMRCSHIQIPLLLPTKSAHWKSALSFTFVATRCNHVDPNFGWEFPKCRDISSSRIVHHWGWFPHVKETHHFTGPIES